MKAYDICTLPPACRENGQAGGLKKPYIIGSTLGCFTGRTEFVHPGTYSSPLGSGKPGLGATFDAPRVGVYAII